MFDQSGKEATYGIDYILINQKVNLSLGQMATLKKIVKK